MASLLKIQTSMVGTESKLTQLILVTTATTGSGVLFQAGVLFSTENAKIRPIWPILAVFSRNIRTFWCNFKVLHNAVVDLYWKYIWGMEVSHIKFGGSGVTILPPMHFYPSPVEQLNTCTHIPGRFCCWRTISIWLQSSRHCVQAQSREFSLDAIIKP